MTVDERVQAFEKIMGEVLSPTALRVLTGQLAADNFFYAPASTKFHGAYEGGLFDHSLAVTQALLMLTKSLPLTWSRPESPYYVGMLHDLCKCDQYIKTESGYKWNDAAILNGHGEKSIIMAQAYGVDLNMEEIACIRWHMGAFDEKENWNRYGNAIEHYPNVLYTHTADMIAARIMKV